MEVPALLGYDNGAWYGVRQGFRGVLVRDEKRVPRVYLMSEPASHCCQIMTRSAWMPVLVGQPI